MEKHSNIITQILLSRLTFIIFSSALIGYNIIGMHFLYNLGRCDYWGHLASMNAFAANPLSPSNPYIPSDLPTHIFTPYHLFWGVIAKGLNIHVFWLFPVIAGINTLLFVASIKIFCHHILGDEKYALTLAMTMLFFWIDPWRWSGFYNFGLLPLTAVYPYWFALPVTLFATAWYGTSYINGRWYKRFILNMLYSFCIGCIFLSHPLTGSFLILSLGIKALLIRSIPLRRRLELLAIPAVGFGLAFLWPYFPVFTAVMRSGSYTALGFGSAWQMFYENALWTILPALFGLPYLIYLLFKCKFTYVPVALVAIIGIYSFNYIWLHNSTLARYVIFIGFLCQAGLVLTLKRLEKKKRLHNYAVTGFLLVTIILALPQLTLSSKLIGPVRDIVLEKPVGTYSNVSVFRQYATLKPYIGNSDVVMAPMSNSWQLPGVTGSKVVGVAQSNPFMSDFFERKRVTERFFNRDTTAVTRADILSRYSVNFVLVPRSYNTTITDFIVHMKLIYQDGQFALYSVM